jgi:hypothetical protein
MTTSEVKTLGELLKEKEAQAQRCAQKKNFRKKNMEALKNEFKEWFINKARIEIQMMVTAHGYTTFKMDRLKFIPLLKFLHTPTIIELLDEIMKEQQIIIQFEQIMDFDSCDCGGICNMCSISFKISKSDSL